MPKKQSTTASEAMKRAEQAEEQEISDHPSASPVEQDRSTSDDEGTSTSNKQGKDDSTSSFQLAKNESDLVAYSKILVVVVIILVAASIGAVTYVVIHNQEKSTYESKVRRKNAKTAFKQLQIVVLPDICCLLLQLKSVS